MSSPATSAVLTSTARQRTHDGFPDCFRCPQRGVDRWQCSCGGIFLCRMCSRLPCPLCGETLSEEDRETISSPPFSASDGFTGFTESEIAVLSPLMRQSGLSTQILTVLEQASQPLSAIAIARRCGLNRTGDVNPDLYQLQRAGTITSSLNGQQPLWHLPGRLQQPPPQTQGYAAARRGSGRREAQGGSLDDAILRVLMPGCFQA